MACGDTCVDTLSAHDNCGMCGHACGAAEVCGNGTCGASCPGNQTECNNVCSDTTTDAMNCGGCGMACSANNVCVDSQCQVPCDHAMLMSAIDDPWGVAWDGLERPAQALDAAKATCQAFGARLPTASELYRVSATQSGTVGQSFNTNYIWSLAPDDKLNQATLRLSDGATTSTPAATATPYRCVCATTLPKTFTGKHCNGAAGNECFTLGNYNIDTKDRPALRKSAAVWECTNERAHMADAPLLVEALRNGLPGSGTFISTADQATYQTSFSLKWTSSTWQTATNISHVNLTTAAPFRCAAPKVAQTPNPNTIANQFVGPLSPYKSETMDSATATWTNAHDACFLRGGHLPRATELAELIEQGLPNGSAVNVWTSDQDGYNTADFLAEVLSWTALEQRFSYQYTGTATWAYKTDSHVFRCIYYPLDPAYVAPTTCTGGCFMVNGGGNPAVTMWFDSTDRAAKTVADASADCAASAGHLASERDYTEAIRSGLPNGSATYLLTSDFAFGNPAATNATVVKWTGTQAAFTDLWSATAAAAAMTWSDPDTVRPYRCMWTNELR